MIIWHQYIVTHVAYISSHLSLYMDIICHLLISIYEIGKLSYGLKFAFNLKHTRLIPFKRNFSRLTPMETIALLSWRGDTRWSGVV